MFKISRKYIMCKRWHWVCHQWKISSHCQSSYILLSVVDLGYFKHSRRKTENKSLDLMSTDVYNVAWYIISRWLQCSRCAFLGRCRRAKRRLTLTWPRRQPIRSNEPRSPDTAHYTRSVTMQAWRIINDIEIRVRVCASHRNLSPARTSAHIQDWSLQVWFALVSSSGVTCYILNNLINACENVMTLRRVRVA